ncbi:MAG: twin-arginine translocase TatA/TatE family subunit [Actinomycetota bacterium]|nr:twin-arginine translocase TatA/TatE family subunit [Actinomycetota bacterium]
MSVGLLEILLLFVVFVALGPRRIANFFRSMGRGVHDFVAALGRDKQDEARTLERGDTGESSEEKRETGPE